jgi:hypothetical protein
VIPVNAIGVGIAHAGEKNPAGCGLFVDIRDVHGTPHGVVLEIGWIFPNGDGLCRTKGLAPVTSYTQGLILEHSACLGIEVMDPVGTLPNANLTANAPGRFSINVKFVKILM